MVSKQIKQHSLSQAEYFRPVGIKMIQCYSWCSWDLLGVSEFVRITGVPVFTGNSEGPKINLFDLMHDLSDCRSSNNMSYTVLLNEISLWPKKTEK